MLVVMFNRQAAAKSIIFQRLLHGDLPSSLICISLRGSRGPVCGFVSLVHVHRRGWKKTLLVSAVTSATRSWIDPRLVLPKPSCQTPWVMWQKPQSCPLCLLVCVKPRLTSDLPSPSPNNLVLILARNVFLKGRRKRA